MLRRDKLTALITLLLYDWNIGRSRQLHNNLCYQQYKFSFDIIHIINN